MPPGEDDSIISMREWKWDGLPPRNGQIQQGYNADFEYESQIVPQPIPWLLPMEGALHQGLMLSEECRAIRRRLYNVALSERIMLNGIPLLQHELHGPPLHEFDGAGHRLTPEQRMRMYTHWDGWRNLPEQQRQVEERRLARIEEGRRWREEALQRRAAGLLGELDHWDEPAQRQAYERRLVEEVRQHLEQRQRIYDQVFGLPVREENEMDQMMLGLGRGLQNDPQMRRLDERQEADQRVDGWREMGGAQGMQDYWNRQIELLDRQNRMQHALLPPDEYESKTGN